VATVARIPRDSGNGTPDLLAHLEDRYRNELMGKDERLQLRDRIRRLKRKLETAEETVDAIHSGLERMES
jgi:predicted RNase H-like nuclease (RuvC/YqgF family)